MSALDDGLTIAEARRLERGDLLIGTFLEQGPIPVVVLSFADHGPSSFVSVRVPVPKPLHAVGVATSVWHPAPIYLRRPTAQELLTMEWPTP